MLDSFGCALRAMRTSGGLSLSSLASRANISKGQLSNLERGARPPTVEVAEALDRALRGGGVLIELAALERGGDEMRRRALLATIGAAVSVGTLDGPHAMAAMIRHGLLGSAGATEDWEQVVEESGRRLVTDPSPLFGSALLTNLMVLRERLTPDSPADLFRAAAGLGQVYGLWLGNRAQLGGAHQWYRSAGQLADRSSDVDMQAYVRGRSASRGIYEGWTIRHTLDTAEQALSFTRRPTLGALEAHAARVSVYALTGEVEAGRKAVGDMADVADHLPDTTLGTMAVPVERMTFLRAFMECRFPDNLSGAERACDEAERALVGLPTWLAETRVYRGRAMVAAGQVADGIACALETVQQMRHEVRVIAVAVRDVCSVVPAGYRSEEYAALRRYADPDPGPWETLR